MSIVAQGSLVFDIGAHIGTTAVEFLGKGAGRVVCVEACWEHICHLIRRPHIIPVHAAAWEKPGIHQIAYCLNSPGWSSCRPDRWSEAYPAAQWAEPEWVACVTLDQLRGTFGDPHLIKIDVEGCEKQVLHGLTQRSPYLIFEFHGKFMAEAVECLRYCQHLGYEKAHYVRDNLDLETVPTTPIDEFIPRWLDDKPEWGNVTVA